MKRRDLVKRLEEIGCVLIRHGASHDWYTNLKTKQSQPIPRHNEINEIYQNQLLKNFQTSSL